jgi:hypothetical protein
MSAMTSPTAMTRSTAMTVSRERDPFERLIRIIRAEFNEMPGMRLTRAQFRRLWTLTEADCDRVLRHFVGSGFLTESGHGFGRPSVR